MRYLNLHFTLPDNTEVTEPNLTVNECMKELKDLFSKYYGLDMKFSRHTIYNLVSRPLNASTIYRQKVRIEMIPETKK